MARSLSRSQKAFALALLTTIVLAFMPAGWLGWTRDIAGVVNLPLIPMRDLGTSIAGWLQTDRPVDPRAGSAQERLLEELQRYERLYHAAELRIQELEEQIEQIQQVPVDLGRTPVRPLIARITAHHPRAREAPVELNRGSRHYVSPGTVAVHRGVYVLGRIDDVAVHRSHLLPITNPQAGYIRAGVLPGDLPEATMRDAVLVQLEPLGNGLFRAEVENTHPIAPGDLVRLRDDAWPRAAQGMIVGRVTDVRPMDHQPLRNRLTIEPFYHVRNRSHVTLLIEIDEDAQNGGRG